jgi:hypothetical protein
MHEKRYDLKRGSVLCENVAKRRVFCVFILCAVFYTDDREQACRVRKKKSAKHRFMLVASRRDARWRRVFYLSTKRYIPNGMWREMSHSACCASSGRHDGASVLFGGGNDAVSKVILRQFFCFKNILFICS